MSHLCTIKTEIRDIQTLREACQALGWQLCEGGKVRYFYGKGQECDYTIEFNGVEKASYGLEKGKFNLGLVKSGTGYEVLCDNAMSGSRMLAVDQQDEVTAGIMGKLKQAYAVAKVKKQAQKQRLRVKQTLNSDGSVNITLEGRF